MVKKHAADFHTGQRRIIPPTLQIVHNTLFIKYPSTRSNYVHNT